MTQEQSTIWNDYMVRIAETDLGCELGNETDKAKRAKLIAELRTKLDELGYS
jgi:hypothetical protein